MNKFDTIMLIDDDETFHLIFKKIIEKAAITEHTVFCLSAEDGLNYLKNAATGAVTTPNLIFLDINMPGINGWDFLEAFKQLEEKLKREITIVMLSSSTILRDKEKAASYTEVADFIVKPFSIEKARETAEKFSNKEMS